MRAVPSLKGPIPECDDHIDLVHQDNSDKSMKDLTKLMGYISACAKEIVQRWQYSEGLISVDLMLRAQEAGISLRG